MRISGLFKEYWTQAALIQTEGVGELEKIVMTKRQKALIKCPKMDQKRFNASNASKGGNTHC